MTSKTKKLFTICASSLIMAGFTADVTLRTNPTTAQAAKHHKKHANKHATKKKVKESPTAGTTPKSKYSSLGAWYLANDKFLYGRYNGQGLFQSGFRATEGATIALSAENYNNGYYKEGWIIGYTNGNDKPTDSELNGIDAEKYNKTINIYNEGVKFIKSSGNIKGAQYDSDSNSWSVDNDSNDF